MAAHRGLRSGHQTGGQAGWRKHGPQVQRHRCRRACARAVHAVGRLHGSAVSRARAEAGQGRERQGAPAAGGQDPRQPRGLRRHRRRRRAPGRRRGRRDGLQGRTQGRLRSARAHPRHGSRRHRRRLPLSQPRPVRRRGQRSRLRRRDVPRLQPLARRLLQALSRPPVRHRHAADAVDRARRSRRCASPARSSASAAASCGPIPTTTASCTTRTTSRSGATAEELDFCDRLPRRRQQRHADGRRRPLRRTRRAAHHLAHHGDDAGGHERHLGRRLRAASRSCASPSSNRAAAGSRPGSTAWTVISTTRGSTIPA